MLTSLERVAHSSAPVRPAATPRPVAARAALLQRCLGNATVARAHGDVGEREAERVAGEVTGAGVQAHQEDTGPSGSPLPDGVRARMESQLGQDFGDVRVHSDPGTDRLAGRLGARAFTHRQDIYLRRGESAHDHRLMAHELTHVVQQRGAAPAVQLAPATKKGSKATDFGVITMEFDGAGLVVSGDGKEIFRYSAQSGRPVRLTEEDAKACGADPATDSYLNDKRFVGVENYGPIPEGSYVFSAGNIETFDFGERLKMELAGVVGIDEVTVHGQPIHAGDWGTGRVALQPRGRLRPGPCGNVAKRSGFFLHGGVLAGSSGCIDIGNGHFDELGEFLSGYRRPIVVTVEYRQPAPTVNFFTGLSGAIGYGKFRLGHGPTLALGTEVGPRGTGGLASVGYEFLLQWAAGALTAGVRLDVPFTDQEAFVRAGLTGALDFRLFGPLYGRLRGGYDWDLSGRSPTAGPELGGGLRLDRNRYQFEVLYNVLRPAAAQDERIHQAFVQLGFKF